MSTVCIYQEQHLIVVQSYLFSQTKWIKVYLVHSATQSKTSGRVWEQILVTLKISFPLTQN